MYSRFPKLLLFWPLLAMVTAFSSGCPTDDPNLLPPIVTLDVRAEETYLVGQDIIQIHVTATDPQGGPLTFRMPDQPPRSQFQTFQNSAVFTWDPIASDVTGDTPRRLIFAVANSQGMTTERVVNLRILAGNGQPRFLNSASELYDPQSNTPLSIHVRVRDDDSNEVALTMPRALAPEGASFEVTGTHEGRFNWMPSPVQITRRVHTVTFVADDGDNPPVEYRVTIIIQQKDGGGTPGPGQGGDDLCEPEAVIAHRGIGAQRTATGYPLEVTLQGPQGARYTDVYAYWTVDDALNGTGQRWESVELVAEAGVFKGSLPNQMLAPGTSREVYYQICAYDMEGDLEDDDAIICGPSSIVYSFVAYSPDHQGCIDDASRSNDPLLAQFISRELYTYHRLCEGEVDYHVIDIEPGEEVLLVVLFPKDHNATFALLDADQVAQSFEPSSCAGFAVANLEVPEGSASKRYYLRASGHDVPYQITAFSSGEVDATCPGQEYEPNDTPAQATLVTGSSARFENIGICSAEDMDIYAIELVRGDIISADLFFTHDDGDLDMALYSPSQQAEVTEQGLGVAQGLSSTDDESIIYTAVESGFYFLNVFTSNEPNIYTLEIETLCVDGDQFAGNHTRADAALIELDAHENLKLCPNQSDWFRRQGFAGQMLLGEVDVRYGGQPSDVTIELYNETGSLLATGEALGNFNDLDYTPTENGPLFFKVTSDRKMLYKFTLYQF